MSCRVVCRRLMSVCLSASLRSAVIHATFQSSLIANEFVVSQFNVLSTV